MYSQIFPHPQSPAFQTPRKQKKPHLSAFNPKRITFKKLGMMAKMLESPLFIKELWNSKEKAGKRNRWERVGIMFPHSCQIFPHFREVGKVGKDFGADFKFYL